VARLCQIAAVIASRCSSDAGGDSFDDAPVRLQVEGSVSMVPSALPVRCQSFLGSCGRDTFRAGRVGIREVCLGRICGRPPPGGCGRRRGSPVEAIEDKFEPIAAGQAVAISVGLPGNGLRPDLTTVPLEGVEPSH
jgi:hypothetical protein